MSTRQNDPAIAYTDPCDSGGFPNALRPDFSTIGRSRRSEACACEAMLHVAGTGRIEIDGRAGGSFRFVDRQAGETIEYTGRYVEIVPERRLVFTLSMEPHPNVITRVTVAIAPLAKGCVLKLTHDNVPRSHASYVEGRWTGILYGLGVTLDSISTTFHHDQE